MILVQKSWSLLMPKWCVDYASLVNMKGVKLLRKWFHAVLVERSITSFVWKIGLNIEVCVWVLLVWFKLFSLSKFVSFCRFISLEFVVMPLLPYLWGNYMLLACYSVKNVCISSCCYSSRLVPWIYSVFLVGCLTSDLFGRFGSLYCFHFPYNILRWKFVDTDLLSDFLCISMLYLVHKSPVAVISSNCSI